MKTLEEELIANMPREPRDPRDAGRKTAVMPTRQKRRPLRVSAPWSPLDIYDNFDPVGYREELEEEMRWG